MLKFIYNIRSMSTFETNEKVTYHTNQIEGAWAHCKEHLKRIRGELTPPSPFPLQINAESSKVFFLVKFPIQKLTFTFAIRSFTFAK